MGATEATPSARLGTIGSGGLDAGAARDVGDAPRADIPRQPRRRDVERFLDRLAHRDHAVRDLVVVLRPPRSARRRDLERRVVEQVRERDRGRAVQGLERRGVHERLEGAAGLTPRLRAAIELRGGVVAPPHQREQLAGLRAQGDETALQRAPGLLGAQTREALLEIRETLAQRDRGEALCAAIERRVDPQPLGLEHARVVDVRELAAQQVEKIPGVARIGRHRGETQRLGLRLGARLRR